MSKMAKYISAIVLLLSLNLFLLFSGGNAGSGAANTLLIEAADIAKLVTISIQNKEGNYSITRSGNQWMINDKKADEGFVSTLLSVISRVEVNRTVEAWEGISVGQVDLAFDSDNTLRFDLGTNAKGTKSYFIEGTSAKEVAVPGYRDNVVEIFQLHPDQWRDRLVFDGSWRTIQSIEIDYAEGNDLEITFDEQFFLINGDPPTDSSAVVDYINQFQFFQVNEIISKGRFPLFDSLSLTEPYATVSIDDINLSNPYVMMIYPQQADQQYHLIKDTQNQLMVLDAQRVENMLVSAEAFVQL